MAYPSIRRLAAQAGATHAERWERIHELETTSLRLADTPGGGACWPPERNGRVLIRTDGPPTRSTHSPRKFIDLCTLSHRCRTRMNESVWPRRKSPAPPPLSVAGDMGGPKDSTRSRPPTIGSAPMNGSQGRNGAMPCMRPKPTLAMHNGAVACRRGVDWRWPLACDLRNS